MSYLPSALDRLMNLLQEIPLSAALGISDGRGVGGLGNEEIGAALINPCSTKGKWDMLQRRPRNTNSLAACSILGMDPKERMGFHPSKLSSANWIAQASLGWFLTSKTFKIQRQSTTDHGQSYFVLGTWCRTRSLCNHCGFKSLTIRHILQLLAAFKTAFQGALMFSRTISKVPQWEREQGSKNFSWPR